MVARAAERVSLAPGDLEQRMSQAVLGDSDSGAGGGPLTDAWRWWRGQRLTFNLSLAIADGAAYGLNAAIFYLGFHHPIWLSVGGGVAMTLFLGALFLLLMGAANIAFLLGPLSEAWLKPADRAGFRNAAFGLGLGASIALPFLFPLANLARLIAHAYGLE
jgi:hypothetical protein